MTLLLALLIISFFLTAAAIVPFIDLLYYLKLKRLKQQTIDAFGILTPVFNKFHQHKAGTPIGGGALIITVVSLLLLTSLAVLKVTGSVITHNFPIWQEVFILGFTLISFGLLGAYDDVKKMIGIPHQKFFGLNMKHKFIIQLLLSLIISWMLFSWLQIDILNIPGYGVFKLGWWFVPFATFVIMSFSNAVNITDGLDGLAAGIFMITMFALWFLSASILDTPLSMLIAILIGSVIAFLYFNIYPARIFLGDVGALSFGAIIAVIGLMIGKIVAVAVIGGLFIIEVGSSLLQLIYKRFYHQKLFLAAPIHLTLQHLGWEEPKIVTRAWLAGIMLAITGMYLATL